MYVFRKCLALVLSVSCLVLAQGAHAQDRATSERVRSLESRVYQLENIVTQLSQRLAHLEYGSRPIPYPNPGRSEVSCMLLDSGYSRPFIGKGRLRLEAEANLRAACSKDVDASYCQATMKCDDQEPITRGAMCILIDAGYKRTFKAEGKSLLESEYKVRKACGQEVDASYCKGEIRCDTF